MVQVQIAGVNMDKKIFLAMSILCFLVLPGLSLAATVENVAAPNRAWIGETVNFSYECVDNSTPLTSTSNIMVNKGGWETALAVTLTNRTYSSTWDTNTASNGVGEYTVRFKCSENGTTATKNHTITLRKLEFGNIDLADAYSDELATEANATLLLKDGESRYVSIPDVSWTVTSKGKDILTSSAAFNEANRLSLDLSDLNLKESEENTVELNFTAVYQGKRLSKTVYYTTKDPAEFSIEQGKVQALDNKNISVDMVRSEYHGHKFNFTPDDIELRFDGEKLDSGKWSLTPGSLTIEPPVKEPGKYWLEIVADLNGVRELEEVEVVYPIQVSGRVVDAKGVPFSGRFVFKSEQKKETVKVKGDGSYKGYVEKGNYTIEMVGFKGIEATFYGVRLDNDIEDLVSYDKFSGRNVDVKGFRVAGGAALAFSRNFRSATLEIEYDDSAYPGLNEEKLIVLKCSNWNFGQRSCNGNWDRLTNYDVHATGLDGYVTVKTSSLSAFMVGEKDQLNIESSVSPKKDRYYLNEELQVQGVVKDSRGNALEGIKVFYQLEGWKEKKSTEANQDGVFSFKIETPSSPGQYGLEVFTKDPVFNNDKQEYTLNVARKKDLSLVLPESLKVGAGENKTVVIKIFNSGQATLTNLSIEVSGLNRFESYRPSLIEKLRPGEKGEIEVVIAPSAEGYKRKITVAVASDEVSREGSFLVLTQNVLESEGKKKDSSGEGSFLLTFTGTFVNTLFSFSVIRTLSLLLSVGVVAMVVKRVKSRERRARKSVLTIGKSLREEFARQENRIEEGFKCEKCGKTFGSKRAIGIHRSKKHKRKSGS